MGARLEIKGKVVVIVCLTQGLLKDKCVWPASEVTNGTLVCLHYIAHRLASLCKS